MIDFAGLQFPFLMNSFLKLQMLWRQAVRFMCFYNQVLGYCILFCLNDIEIGGGDRHAS